MPTSSASRAGPSLRRPSALGRRPSSLSTYSPPSRSRLPSAHFAAPRRAQSSAWPHGSGTPLRCAARATCIPRCSKRFRLADCVCSRSAGVDMPIGAGMACARTSGPPSPYSVTELRSELGLDDGPHLPLATQDIDTDVFGVTLELNVHYRVTHGQLANLDPVDAGGQSGLVEAESTAGRVDLEPQAGLKEQEHRGRGPGLGRTGHGEKDRRGTGLVLESAEELRHALEVEVRSGVEQAGEDRQH